jgi:addiction module RelE/StbE family toxin
MREIFVSATFAGRLAKFLNYHPEFKNAVAKAFKSLKADIRMPSLQTHKLHGKMKDSYACNINYQYRIVFTFDDKLIYPESIGSHEDVYFY